MKSRIFIVVLNFLLLLGWGLFLYQYSLNKSNSVIRTREKYHGIRFHKEAPNFVLTDHNGKKTSLSKFKGKLVLMAWGFTHCPDICPLILSELDNVIKGLGDVSDRVQVLFITIDPERDTVERLKDYVPSFNKSFIGLTGTPDEIEQIVEEYEAFFIKHPEVYGRGEFDTWDSYQMSHTTSVYLVDQKGRLYLHYPYDKLSSKEITADIKRIMKFE